MGHTRLLYGKIIGSCSSSDKGCTCGVERRRWGECSNLAAEGRAHEGECIVDYVNVL